MFSYSVAIRTLGTAGEKYQQELESLKHQTIPPKKIIVYIAEGYPIPKETIGIEEYVYVKKGMVSQRALPYDEIDTDYILLLDDDVYLAPNAVEKLYYGLIEKQADCIAADTFRNQDMSRMSKLKAFITNWAYPRKDDKWAFKIQTTGSFSYNNSPSKEVYLSQSAAGPCSLWNKKAFTNINFEVEKWLEEFPFAYGDDLLCFYKLYINGYTLSVHYNAGIIHLDAGVSSKKYKQDSKRLLYRSMIWFILWWRISYSRDNIKLSEKIISIFAWIIKCIWGVIIHLLYSLSQISFKPILYYIKGILKGWKYVHSEKFKQIPNFFIS